MIEKYINVAGRNINCRNISNYFFRNNPDEKTLQIKYIEFCSRGKLSLFKIQKLTIKENGNVKSV